MSGGTKLDAGMKLASKEIAKHDRPITAIVLTDGEDKSIEQMLKNIQVVKDAFEGVGCDN